jgi:hypothetical protein
MDIGTIKAVPHSVSTNCSATREIDHQLWIFPLVDFINTNEEIKTTFNTDLITLTQLVQSGNKLANQIKLLGVMGRAYIKQASDGKKYIIFKGISGDRPNLTGTRYLSENPKVASFVVGTQEILEDSAKATRISVVAFIGIDILKECLSDKFSLARLGVNIASDIVQALLTVGIGVAAGALLVAVGAPTVLTFAIITVIGFGAGIALSTIDEKYKLTERARARMMALENNQTSFLYKAEHKVGEEISAIHYTVDRVWHSVEDMIAFDKMHLMF